MAPPKTPKEFHQAVVGHRNRLQNLVTKPAAKRLKSIYDVAQAETVAKLRAQVRAGRGETFTAYQHRVALAQLRDGQMVMARKLAGGLTQQSKNAQEVSLSGLIGDVKKLSKKFTGAAVELPIEEASVFAGVIDKQRASLIKMHNVTSAKYAARVVTDVEKNLSLSLLSGETAGNAIDRVQDLLDNEWWQAERIVRTEMAYAFNVTQRDGLEESQEELPELMMRWEENCDEGGEPLDDRVAVDSIAMHGQVAEPGGVFTMPATAPFPDADGKMTVPSSLVGMSWEFPPNRPNDRSVLSPWMPDWGVPGWQWKGGRRVWLNR